MTLNPQRPRISPSGPLETGAAPGTFYQTVEEDGTPLPQRTALNLINATVADNVGNGSTDVTLAYQQVLDSDGGTHPQQPALQFGPNLSVVDQGGSTRINLARQQLPNVTALDNTSVLAVSGGVWQTVVPTGYSGTYYIDPNFVGLSSGSQTNPFTTCAAAFAYAASLGIVNGVLNLPPGITLTENVVFPPGGSNWEIACSESFATSTIGARITGTLTLNNTAAVTVFRLTRVIVSGAVTGSTSGTALVALRQARLLGAVSFAVTGSGVWVALANGDGVAESNNQSGVALSTFSVAFGALLASTFNFVGAVSSAPNLAQFNAASVFDACHFQTGAIGLNGAAGTFHRFKSCTFDVLTTFTAANACTVILDGDSMASLLRAGFILAGAAITLQTSNSNASVAQLIAGNVGATNVSARAPKGLYEAVASLDLIAAGTAGTAVLNVIYTDLNGTLQTKAVTAGLLITAAVGTEATGTLLFRHNGATAVQFSVTGIVTPGALSIDMAVAVMRRD